MMLRTRSKTTKKKKKKKEKKKKKKKKKIKHIKDLITGNGIFKESGSLSEIKSILVVSI